MITVIDASAAVEIVLQKEKAPGLEQHLDKSKCIAAPFLYIPEITNVFWKYHAFKNLPVEFCENAIENAIGLPDEYHNEHELYNEAFAMGCQTGKPVYDMFYLVLARRSNAWLMTLDKSLRLIAEKHSVRIVPVI